MNRFLIILVVCFVIQGTIADLKSKRQECRDLVGDRSNCQRFVRCFQNLRVLFTCAKGTAYVPELRTCVPKESVKNCNDSKDRIDIVISSNLTQSNDEYPTIEADANALESPLQKGISVKDAAANTPKQFGCQSYCQNQGVCVLVSQSVTCQCANGYTGLQCQVAHFLISTRQGCISNPCDNGGSCTEVYPNTIMCICPPGFIGSLCSYPDIATTTITSITQNPNQLCVVNPCFNGAFCLPVSGGGFRCVCPTGYTGLLCDYPDTRPSTGCGIYNPCLNSGYCISTTIGYQCQCINNYSGSRCQINTAVLLLQANLCQPSPCQNGGTCYLRQGTFGCSCLVGFSGVCCEINLVATNPCYTNPCINGGTCQVAGPNLFRCVCPVGFNGIQCEICVCDPNPCLYGGICIVIGNSFQCQCPPQYTGPTCAILINPCASQPCLNGGTCTATSPTTYVCSCIPSFYGPCCEIRNYCVPSPCYNGGSCVATTTGYLCQCSYPYTGPNCEGIIVTRAPQPLCACVVCPCPTPVVTVVNPCLPNPCQNNGGCAVVYNAARCYCPSSYTGYYCQFARKRVMSNAPCSNITCLNGGECIVDEDGPQCTCPKPYYGDRCELINRPRTCSPSPCGVNGHCISTKDGYKCVCKNGTTGILCEQKMMPKNYRWCPIDCKEGTSCVYEGNTPKCRVL